MNHMSNLKEFFKLGATCLSVVTLAVSFTTIMTHQKEVDENLHNIFGKTVFANVEDVRFGILNKEAFKDVPNELKKSYRFFLEDQVDTIQYKQSLKNKEFFEYELANVRQTREEFLASEKEMKEALANDPEYQKLEKQRKKVMADLEKEEKESKSKDKVVVIDLLKEITPEEIAKNKADMLKRQEEAMREPLKTKVVLKSIHDMREKVKLDVIKEVNEEFSKIKPK